MASSSLALSQALLTRAISHNGSAKCVSLPAFSGLKSTSPRTISSRRRNASTSSHYLRHLVRAAAVETIKTTTESSLVDKSVNQLFACFWFKKQEAASNLYIITSSNTLRAAEREECMHTQSRVDAGVSYVKTDQAHHSQQASITRQDIQSTSSIKKPQRGFLLGKMVPVCSSFSQYYLSFFILPFITSSLILVVLSFHSLF